MSLPRLIALESAAVDEFLYFVEEDGDYHGALRAYGQTILSPYAKFEVEKARSGGNHVNIRSCYNNKYWARGTRKNAVMICCDAEEPQEDTSLLTCTLFEPIFTTIKNRNFIRLTMALDGLHLNVTSRVQDPQNFLELASCGDSRGLFSVSDWESLYVLPKYVTFKVEDKEFLSARTIDSHPYLQFASNDIGDSTVWHEVFSLRDGAVRLKSNHFSKFWRRSPNWIWADSDDSTRNNLDTVFWPVRVSDIVVALRNLGNNNFCKSLTTDGETSCLNAAVPTISTDAHLEVHETVLSRHISNVNFRLMDAKIYSEHEISIESEYATNKNTDSDVVPITLYYSDTETRSFNSSVTLKLGVKTKIKTRVPYITWFDRIILPIELQGKVEWGFTSVITEKVEKTYTVTLPPMTSVRVRLLATQGRCVVPFSYTQRDKLTSRQITTTTMNDGVYTGANYFNFRHEIEEKPLS